MDWEFDEGNATDVRDIANDEGKLVNKVKELVRLYFERWYQVMAR